jgi:hypothetical protein
MVDVDNNFSGTMVDHPDDDCDPEATLARWMLTAVPDAVTSVGLRGGGSKIPLVASAASPASVLPSLNLAGLLLRTQSASLRELSFVGSNAYAWSVLSAVCEHVGPVSLRSLQVAGSAAGIHAEASRWHFLTALAHCRGLTTLSVAHVFPLSKFISERMSAPATAEQEPQATDAADDVAALAAAAVAVFGPTVRTLKCYLYDAADVRSVAALPTSLPQLCSLTLDTMSHPVRTDRSGPARAAIAAVLPMLTCLNIHGGAMGGAAASYAAKALAAPQLLTPVLPLQTLRPVLCDDLEPFLRRLQPSVAPAHTQVDFAGRHVRPEVALALAKLTHCTSLSIGVRWLDDARLHRLLSSMPQLRRLTMADPGRFNGGDKYTQWAARQLLEDDVATSKRMMPPQPQPQPRLKHQALCPNVRRLSGVSGSLWQRLIFPQAKLDPED